ncbi:MAG TPA: YraN family protein [Acidimicrobiales bacterium]|nr:YraN family protein [Acidimicrobiales bacterium]
MTKARRELGARGEDAVAAWYEAAGYDVVARNWRCRTGELDLILRLGATYVFCEVKTRTSSAFGAPQEAVTRKKQLRLRSLAAQWLHTDAPSSAADLRFDVACVLDNQIEVLEGAF